jgi:hypothetical protein
MGIIFSCMLRHQHLNRWILLIIVHLGLLRVLSYRTHRCVLYHNVGWTSLSVRREQHALVFVYKALLNKLPSYLSSLINIRIRIPKTRSQAWITLEAHAISTELGMTAFSCCTPCLWNSLQTKLKT